MAKISFLDNCVSRINTDNVQYAYLGRVKNVRISQKLELEIISGDIVAGKTPLRVNLYLVNNASEIKKVDSLLKEISYIRKFLAHYGIYDHFKDVSEIIINIIKDGILKLDDKYNEIFGDPVEHKKKYLVIKHPYLSTSKTRIPKSGYILSYSIRF